MNNEPIDTENIPNADIEIENLPSPIQNNNEHSYQDVVEEFLNNSYGDKDDSISGHVYFERIK